MDFTLFQQHNNMDLEPLSKTIKSVFPMAQTAWSTSMMEQHEGEASSLLSALNRTQDWEADHIKFEPDCKSATDVIHRNRGDLSEFGLIISLCKNILSNHQNFKVVLLGGKRTW
ncbi:hypothetical protein L195_g015425 [Trifolium pratense]|uniref:RNase H type-1 domain-containing protein n=1 Tax=Trifolium pratense TaxID=57577 RepID=A0A2K3MNA5_TRIPR|nr:hypothetical protein L195_g015425 [Trifolium pratense]